MALDKVEYIDNETVITAKNMNDIQDAIIANTESIENGPVAPTIKATYDEETQTLVFENTPTGIEDDSVAPTLRATYDEETKTMVFENVPKEMEDSLYAPSGYGLGGNAKFLEITDISQLDSIWENGWYSFALPSPITVNNISLDYAYMRVDSYDNAGSFQTLYALNRTRTILSRATVGGVWDEWGCENPPMELGMEYRTTERHNGKVVYAKYYDAGILTNNTLYSLPSGTKDIVKFQAYTSKGHLLPVGQFIKDDTTSAYFAYAATNAGANGVYAFTDTKSDGFGNGSYNLYLKLWYTKD